MSQKYYGVSSFYLTANDGVEESLQSPLLLLNFVSVSVDRWDVFRATPLLACQLVSGHVLYSVCVLASLIWGVIQQEE